MGRNDFALLHGTLDFLILKAVSWGARHGYGIARWIERVSDEALGIEEGSLYPALHRMQKAGLVEGSWGVTENNRRAKYYRLTAAGERRLELEQENWARFAAGVEKVAAAGPDAG